MINSWFTPLPWVHYLNFQQKECYHAARFEKATRYYVIRLEKDLLGDWIITDCNGRIKSRLGQSRIIAFSNFFDAFERFCRMAKERSQRRYHLIYYQTDDIQYQQILLWVCFIVNPVLKKNTTPRKTQVRASPNQIPATQPLFRDIQQMSFVF